MPKASGGDISCCSRCTGKQRSVYRSLGGIFSSICGLRAHIWNILNGGVNAFEVHWPFKAGKYDRSAFYRSGLSGKGIAGEVLKRLYWARGSGDY